MNIIQSLPPKEIVTFNTPVSLDIEMFQQTDGKLHRPTGDFACISVGIGDDVYVIQDKKLLPELFQNIERAQYWILHNALYDIRQLRRWVEIKDRPLWDTMIVEQVLWGGYYGIGEFSLADLTRRYLDYKMDKDTRDDFIRGSYMTQSMLEYAALDANLTLQVYQKQQEEIALRKYDMKVYWDADEPSIWTILDLKPVKVNVKRWLEMAEEFVRRGREIEEELGVNVYSHTQVKEYIYKLTRKQIKDTQETTLTELEAEYPQVKQLLLARRYRKASSTYGEKWITENVEDGNLVYSDFHVNGTETGRWSSSSPNLLNIPARKIPEYRELFINNKGRMIVADISQQEPRCLAYLSNDKNLIKAFVDKEDIHLYVTRNIFNDDTIEKGDPRRDVGKMINLATSYGMTAKGLASRLQIGEDDAEKFLRAYFNRFPDVDNYIKRQRIYAQSHGYVNTIMGRRIWINPHNFQADNNAINAPIQGSSADFTKVWVNDFRSRCIIKGVEFPVCAVIYDEVLMDVEKENEAMYIEMLTGAFYDTAKRLVPTVPFALDVEKGKSWACKRLAEEDEE